MNSLSFVFTRLPLVRVTLSAWILGASILSAKTELPSGGIIVTTYHAGQNINFWQGSFNGEPVGSMQEVSSDHPDFDTAIRITVTNPSGNFWTGGGRFPIATAASQGDVGIVRLFFRTIQTLAETGAAVSTVFVQGPANEKSIVREITSDNEWKEYLIPFSFIESYNLGDVELHFGMGAGSHAQTYEIGGIEVVYYGTNRTIDELPSTKLSYIGRETDASWRVDAAVRIETHRKGDFTLKVVDLNGVPVPFAKIDVAMTRHAFEFGSAFATADILGESENSDTLREKTVELFNSGGPFNHLKWRAWAGDWGGAQWVHQNAFDALAWMTDQGLAMRGHVLVWPSARHLPKIVTDLIPEDPTQTDPAVKQMALDHIDAVTTATSQWITEWDVVNEPFDNHDLMDAFGNEVILDWFAQAKTNLPTQDLYLNDYNILSDNVAHQQHYEDTLQFLVDNNAPINGMGMQGHMGASPTGIPSVQAALQRYSSAFPDLKIRVTEFTVDTDDEDLQADYTRDFYTMLFSHPEVVGVQFWGFWAKDIDDNKGLYAHDWREKPSALAYKDLVLDQWWSRFSDNTQNDGTFQKRGFYGDYQATVTVEGIPTEFEFKIEAGMDTLTLQLPITQAILYPTYETWAAANFTESDLAAGLITGRDHDADNDGWSNRYEYSFALQNGVHETSLFRSIEYNSTTDSLDIQFARTLGISSLSHRLETSTDLLTWTPTASTEIIATEPSYTVLELTIPAYLGEQQKRFIRLSATQGE